MADAGSPAPTDYQQTANQLYNISTSLAQDYAALEKLGPNPDPSKVQAIENDIDNQSSQLYNLWQSIVGECNDSGLPAAVQNMYALAGTYVHTAMQLSQYAVNRLKAGDISGAESLLANEPNGADNSAVLAFRTTVNIGMAQIDNDVQNKNWAGLRDDANNLQNFLSAGFGNPPTVQATAGALGLLNPKDPNDPGPFTSYLSAISTMQSDAMENPDGNPAVAANIQSNWQTACQLMGYTPYATPTTTPSTPSGT